MKIRLRNRLRMCALLSLLLVSGMQSAQAQTYRLLFQFRAGVDGAAPLAGLVSDPNGNLYGTTSSDGARDSGVVFKIRAPHRETVLHSFTGSGGDGAFPYGGLVRDAAGSLYGTTDAGGKFGDGTVFKVDTSGAETILYNFGAYSGDGILPSGALIRDAAGNLYGTTQSGGTLALGTVFKVDTTGKETLLHSFAGGTKDGEVPFLSGLVRDSKGNLYGVTNEGGRFTFGTVFKLAPSGKETLLHSFNGKDGKIPYGSLLLGAKGNLYGTASAGGAYGGGVVYELTP